MKRFAILKTLIKYVTTAPKTKKLSFAFQEMFILFKKSKATAVKIRRLSMPAQGHAIANFAVPNEPVPVESAFQFQTQCPI